MEHDQLLSEVVLRLYGCNLIRIKNDSSGKSTEYKEIVPIKYISKSYETHVNLLAAMFTLETDNNYFIVYRGHYENNLLDCLNFSPALVDKNYTRGLFLIYQLLNVAKAMSDRGLSLGMLELQDVYLTENLWLQITPSITNNIHTLDASLIYELNRSKQATTPAVSSQGSQGRRGQEWCWRNEIAHLEKLCSLWVKGRISNLDYLLHMNMLAGRSANDPQAHLMVPWVTDFASRCGKYSDLNLFLSIFIVLHKMYHWQHKLKYSLLMKKIKNEEFDDNQLFSTLYVLYCTKNIFFRIKNLVNRL